MGDLISREDLKKKLTPIKLYDGVYCKAITEKDIDNAPTIPQTQISVFTEGGDKEELEQELQRVLDEIRPKGKWEDHSCSFYFCSNCGMGNNNAGGHKTRFCPNCGADMRGKEE